MSRVVCVVQARFGSSRLPGKALRPLAGRPMLAHVLERAAAIPGIDALVLATSTRDSDDALVEVASAQGICTVRGSELDVLDRVRVAAQLARAEVVVRITGDCPFLDPEVAGFVVQRQQETGYYVWNDTFHSGFPDGTDAEAFPMDWLTEAWVHARGTEREHVTPWIRANRDVVTVMASTFDYSWMKLSVDTFLDYERAVLMASELPAGDFSLAATVRAREAAVARAWGVL